MILIKSFSHCVKLSPTIRLLFNNNHNQIPLLLEVEAKIMQVIFTAKPDLEGSGSIDREQKFEDMGFDSLDKTELIVQMEDFFQEDLSDEEARNIENLGQCIDIFFRKLNAKVTNKLVMRNSQNFTPTQ